MKNSFAAISLTEMQKVTGGTSVKIIPPEFPLANVGDHFDPSGLKLNKNAKITGKPLGIAQILRMHTAIREGN